MMLVGPSPFHQYSAGMAVAGFCNTAPPDSFTAGMFRRNQAKICHKFFWILEAGKVSQFSDCDSRTDQRYSPQCLKCLYHGSHSPFLHSQPDLLTQSCYPPSAFMYRFDIFLESNLLGRILHAN